MVTPICAALQAPCGDTYLCCSAGKLSKSADVYAFGVLLWEMYTGQRPWSGLGQMQVIFHLTQRKKRLQFPSGTPPQLQVMPLLLLLVLYLFCCCLFLPLAAAAAVLLVLLLSVQAFADVVGQCVHDLTCSTRHDVVSHPDCNVRLLGASSRDSIKWECTCYGGAVDATFDN